MRLTLATLLVLAAGVAAGPAAADPYRWCAQYAGGSNGGGTNCYFVTLQQCQAAASGNGGWCVANNFYDGGPVVTPGEGTRSRARR